MAIFSNLTGTTQQKFVIGKNGATLETSPSELSIRDYKNINLIPISIGEPTNASNATTVNYINSNYSDTTTLSSTNGATLIGTTQNISVQEYLNDISSSIKVSSISELRTIKGSDNLEIAHVISYYNEYPMIGGGFFKFDSSDTTSIDNGFDCIVANDGSRFKKMKTSTEITPQHAGSIGDGKLDDTDKIITILNSYDDIFFPDGIYILDCNKINVSSGQTIKLSPNAVVNIQNTSGTSGPGYSAKVFTISGDSTNLLTQASIVGVILITQMIQYQLLVLDLMLMVCL